MIAVDAMGGDSAPAVAVKGAYYAARKGISVMLFGDQRQIEASLHQLDSSWRTAPISIVHCSQRITMEEVPTRSVTEKTDSSLVQAMKAVAQGRASAVVSAGNSGAALVAATLHLKRIAGVIRPAIGRFLPTRSSQVFCIDLGANTDTRFDHLLQFAYMGHCFVQLVRDITHPRIGLLANGHERYKGSKAAKEAYALLEGEDLNFVGNVEPRHFFEDHVDIVVCDGLMGNVMLKTMEETARMVTFMLSQAYRKTFLGRLLGFITKPIVKGVLSYSDYHKKEGALLLGLTKPCVIAHGCSSSNAIEHSIIFAHNIVKNGTISSFNEKLSGYLKQVSYVAQADALDRVQT